MLGRFSDSSSMKLFLTPPVRPERTFPDTLLLPCTIPVQRDSCKFIFTGVPQGRAPPVHSLFTVVFMVRLRFRVLLKIVEWMVGRSSAALCLGLQEDPFLVIHPFSQALWEGGGLP